MREYWKILVPLFFAMLVGGFIARGGDLISDRTFAAREEQVRHDVFKESQAYNDGMAQTLGTLYLEWGKADPEHQAAIRSVVLYKVAAYRVDRLPPDLQNWIADLKR